MRQDIHKNIYRRQMIEMANEAMKQIIIPASIIQNTLNDMELGNLVRTIYIERCNDAKAHIDYIKSLN